jgi:hypothetical protein
VGRTWGRVGAARAGWVGPGTGWVGAGACKPRLAHLCYLFIFVFWPCLQGSVGACKPQLVHYESIFGYI